MGKRDPPADFGPPSPKETQPKNVGVNWGLPQSAEGGNAQNISYDRQISTVVLGFETVFQIFNHCLWLH